MNPSTAYQSNCLELYMVLHGKELRTHNKAPNILLWKASTSQSRFLLQMVVQTKNIQNNFSIHLFFKIYLKTSLNV